jgi:NADH-quinone oxidoreductase subunit L
MTVAYYPLLILLAPLTAAMAIGLLEGTIGRKVYQIGTAAQVAALVISFWVLYQVGAGTGPIHVPLSSAESGLFQFGLYIDRLAAVMMTLVSAIGLLIFLFSIRYMEQERGHTRFHALLNLTTFILLCMVASRNLLMLFLFWQLISWMLYLLSHNYSHPATVQGAAKTYTVLRVGDIAFLAGVVLAYRTYGTLDFPELFINAVQTQETFSLGGFSIGAPTVITLLIFVGAMSKSVQFPMHIWLSGNLYAPTPVTAFLHAGIINAGGFLINRLAPLYGLSPATLHLALAIGLLTTLLGATMMLTQNDIKKTLAHSTIGQMGYMIMECGLGGFALAIFHLIAHGLFKATVFLDSGHVIHAARQEPRHPPLHDPKTEPGAEEEPFSGLTWGAGFLVTLLFPLIILLAAHGALRIPLIDSQGVVIFLFFSWVTSSQAILTLYRLRAVSSWKVAALMLLTLLVVVLTYLFAAEHFTKFLYPTPGEAAAYFQAAHLPWWLFDFLVAAIALCVIGGWIVIYARSHGRSIPVPGGVQALQVRLYILFMNRLYLEALSARLGRAFSRGMQKLDRSALFPPILGLSALVVALGRLLPAADRVSELSLSNVPLFLIAALLLPLFPLHGLYVAALTRLSGTFPALLALLMPVSGLYAIKGLLPEASVELLGAVRALALFGAVYGSLKALAQFRVERLLAYAGVALASILWWYLAGAASDTPQGAIYVAALSLITGGLLLAWRVVQARYGNLDLNRISGLARPMPRFALLLSLLVTAAMGLPPFGLFSGLMEMLMNRSAPMSWDLAVILLTWLAASWFFLNLMQRLLFGPPRPEIPYTDLRGGEIAPLATALLILLALGIAPYAFFQSTPATHELPSTSELNASVEGEAHPAKPDEGVTQTPITKQSLWKK